MARSIPKPLRSPVLVSVLLHAALLAFLMRTPRAAARADAPLAAPAAWAGNTFDLDLAGIDPGKGAEAPPSPQQDAPAKDAAPAEAAPPSARRSRAQPRPDREAESLGASRPAGASQPAGRIASRPGAASAPAGREGGDAGDGKQKGGTFGAEGQSAARDLGSAFTRAIGPANQADAAWSRLPVGPLGVLEIAVSVDEAGHVEDAVPLSAAPPEVLVGLVKRTLILLRGGVFHLKKGEASAGRQVLRLRAEVSDVDGTSVQGGTIDLEFKYQAGRGKAAFTRPGGRHVEVSVTLVRVELRP